MSSGRSGTPNTLACAVPSFMNVSEHTTAAITPRLVNCAMSWTLHDVQDPQSAIALMTRSASFASSSSTWSVAGRLEVGLRL